MRGRIDWKLLLSSWLCCLAGCSGGDGEGERIGSLEGTGPHGNNYHDSRLDAGEVFILPARPLTATTAYRVRVSASDSVGGLPELDWTFTTGGDAAPALATDEVGQLNAYRQQAGVTDDLEVLDFLTEAATRHAGYQAHALAISHLQTDAGNPFYVAYSHSERINTAATGDPNVWPNDYHIAYEDVATTGGIAAVDLWWDSVYHRLPMMRFDVVTVGFGDRGDARALEPGIDLPATSQGFGTMEFLGQWNRTRTLSHWPADGQTGVIRLFATDSELPDPLDGYTGSDDVNGAPAVGVSGVPIHVIYPTRLAFETLAVEVTEADSGAAVAVYVLHGAPP